jgi:hypothetical protein
MPAHDGTGHFFTPGPALSPAASEYDFNPITAQSLLSLSDFDLENDELLSIPSSLSISHSASSRYALTTHLNPNIYDHTF